jgi:hypothetical protein
MGQLVMYEEPILIVEAHQNYDANFAPRQQNVNASQL